jgi:hypothetical protein
MKEQIWRDQQDSVSAGEGRRLWGRGGSGASGGTLGEFGHTDKCDHGLGRRAGLKMTRTIERT